jgi:hypothetical protein
MSRQLYACQDICLDDMYLGMPLGTWHDRA